MPNPEEIAKLVALVVSIGGAIVGTQKWLESRRRAKRIRSLPAGDFPFEVIEPRNPDLLKRIMGGDENNPLADYRIPYQERQPDRNIRKELESAFTEKNWVLILGKSGLGKTREAAHLADVLNQEGWTVLKLEDRAGEWLDVPKEFPSQIRPDDKLLFFLDNLNRWMYAGNSIESHPKAVEELARPLREPVQERLPRLLQYFERQCRSSHVRVIATARDEREPDKVGDTSPWEKLQWEKYKSFWQQFYQYPLVEPSEGAIVRLLTECVVAAGLRGVAEEYEQIARRNDDTFLNITLNLDSAQSRGLAVNNQEFSERLDQTWRRKYNRAVERYPLAVYVYDAVELMRTLNLWLKAPMLSATTKCLLPGRGIRRWWQEWQLRRVLKYLVTTEQILQPKDGQIEMKKTGAVDVVRYVPAILHQLGQIAKQDPTYPVSAECFDCGNALYRLERYEDAIASYDKALEVKPDNHEAWYNRGVALSALGRNDDAITSYDKALEVKPDKHEAWNNRGVALSALGRNDDAITSYDKALEVKPDYYRAWDNRGDALMHLERYEEAIAGYNQAIEINPEYPFPWQSRGFALMQLRQLDVAHESFDQAILLKPDDDRAYYDKACCYGLQNQIDSAIATLQQAITLDSECRDEAKTDADFDLIRQDDRFKALIGE